jgi:hypothetical protein
MKDRAPSTPVKHGEEHRRSSLNLCRAPGDVDDHGATGLLPQPLGCQRGSDPVDRNLHRGIIGERTQHHRFGRKPRARAQRAFRPLARWAAYAISPVSGAELLN